MITERLSVKRGEHLYVFRYHRGQEHLLIDSFASLADSNKVEFDWFDAAVLSYQVGQQVELELDPLGD